MHVNRSVPNRMFCASGFTLIELMVALAIFGLLLMLAGPQYALFMANHQIRNAADAMLNGVQQAQTTAIQRNAHVCLIVTPRAADSDPPGSWKIVEDSADCPEVPAPDPAPSNPIQSYKAQDGAPNTLIAPVPGDATTLVFDGFGRINDKLADGTDYTPMTCIKLTHSLSGSHPLSVAISSTAVGVGTKLCDPDPSLPAGDPMRCPAQCT